ncbi:hypothetical protein K9U39_18450 [Rhodoblastus acidophilus]|uniref:PhyR sigma2 domain-containing protein n=1 Tax=Candidatus Rhodoblastus alkanivorans TaxID=2954117 RepID=A0ABS9Z319_9HYPH|nr:sigma factor [Candidatus Rhodoblastus alkanivorans]MCI4677481.1 hypothetical protein [Candidatus Rhodoblastus alkanivorans]MCI4681840.1 hypothetical protein [Candidatus Rhodoblastus alkanivorans]MDI4642890.1 hypothetical protein [Rhodoblastus acidophilus]
MTAKMDFKTALRGELAQLRFFALLLCHTPDRSDDLAQETLIKTWAAEDRFQPGTSLRARLFTIMRNTLASVSQFRSRRFRRLTKFSRQAPALEPQVPALTRPPGWPAGEDGLVAARRQREVSVGRPALAPARRG